MNLKRNEETDKVNYRETPKHRGGSKGSLRLPKKKVKGNSE